jgi:hypothetical protein
LIYGNFTHRPFVHSVQLQPHPPRGISVKLSRLSINGGGASAAHDCWSSAHPRPSPVSNGSRGCRHAAASTGACMGWRPWAPACRGGRPSEDRGRRLAAAVVLRLAAAGGALHLHASSINASTVSPCDRLVAKVDSTMTS